MRGALSDRSPTLSVSQLQLSLVSALWRRRAASVSRFSLIRGDRLNPSHRAPRAPDARSTPVCLVPVPQGVAKPGRANGHLVVVCPPAAGNPLRRQDEALQRRSSLTIDETFSSNSSSSSRDATRLHPHLQPHRKHTTSRLDLLRASSLSSSKSLTEDECNSRLSVHFSGYDLHFSSTSDL